MNDDIQFARGKEEKLPTLAPGEPGYCTDTHRLYIGTPDGNLLIADNVRLLKVDDLVLDVMQLEEDMLTKLTASPVALQAAVASGAQLADVITALNALVTAMKASGVMSTE